MDPAGSHPSNPIAWIGLSSVYMPLTKAVSDATVLTGRQKPLEGVWILFAEIAAADGGSGLGFSYALRSGGPAQYAHARELAPELIGEDANDTTSPASGINSSGEAPRWAGAASPSKPSRHST